MIKIGDRLPDVQFMTLTSEGPKPLKTAEVFSGKKVAIFAVPGAYTPTCHNQHMPGFLTRADYLKSKGVDTIACTAVNDVFVMDSWAKASNASGKILMLTDDSASFAKAIGLEIDLTGTHLGLGVRSKRYSMLVDNQIVKVLNVDESPPVHDKSSAEALCKMIDNLIL